MPTTVDKIIKKAGGGKPPNSSGCLKLSNPVKLICITDRLSKKRFGVQKREVVEVDEVDSHNNMVIIKDRPSKPGCWWLLEDFEIAL